MLCILVLLATALALPLRGDSLIPGEVKDCESVLVQYPTTDDVVFVE